MHRTSTAMPIPGVAPHRRPAVVTIAIATVLAALVAVPTPARAATVAYEATIGGPSLAAMYPSGLEYDPNLDRLVIADTGLDRVLVYTPTGNAQTAFGTPGTANGQFLSPRDIAIDGDSNIYVADAENNRVQKFDQNGVWQWTVGGIGRCDTCLNTPIGVTWDATNGVLLVASTGQHLIKAFGPDGLHRWTSPAGSTLGFTAPRDVTRGPDGRIWVTAYREHQIKAYDVTPAGVWTTTPAIVLGDGLSQGTGAGQHNFPYNIVFSPDGTVGYVSDTGNGRVARWDLSGATPTWLPQFGANCPEHPAFCPDPPAAPGEFNHLRRVAIDGAGNVFAADFWGNGIEVFAPDGTVVRQIEGHTAALPGFAEAYGVGVAPNGEIYVMDRLNHRIQRFAADGTLLGARGSRGVVAGTFSWPEAVTVGPDGTVWALDTRGDRVERFAADLSGTVTVFGGSGSGVGQFSFPSGLTVGDDGRVWITDTRNDRIQILDPVSGTFSVFPVTGTTIDDPEGIALGSGGVYVADTKNNRVVRLANDGTFIAAYAGVSAPEGVATASDGTLWVADTGNDRLVHLAADLTHLADVGASGTGPLQFDRPHAIDVHGERLYVADTFNHRVQVLTGAIDPQPFAPAYIGAISDPAGVAPLYPAGGVTTSSGDRYVADSGGSRIVRIDPSGIQTTVSGASAGWNDPRDIVLDPDGSTLWAVNTSASTVVHFATDGTILATFGPAEFTTPYGLDIDATGVYVADTYDNEVVKLNATTGAVLWRQSTCSATAFSRPRDVGLGPDGNLYVTDTDNDRIAVLAPDTGACVRGFGTRGTANGQFRSPRAVASDGASGIWVADAFNYRVQHLTTTGGFIAKTSGGAGTGPSDFRQPGCVWLDGAVLAVCDTWNHRIQRFDVGATGTPTFRDQLGGVPPAAGGFNGPFGVGYAPNGDLYTTDWFNHRVQRFDASHAFISQWGGYGTVNGAMIFPRDVLVTPTGDTVVLTNSEANRLDLFTPAGGFVRSIRPTGDAFSRPHQTALAADGSYWVADTLKDRVIHLDGTGAVLGSFAATRPRGVAIDGAGTLYVSLGSQNQVASFTQAGTRIATLSTTVRNPHGLTIANLGGEDLLFVADTNNNRVQVLTLTGTVRTTIGSAGAGNGQLSAPRGVAVDTVRGVIAIADHANNRISLWSTSGGTGDTTPPGVTIAAPTAGQVLPLANVQLSGSATDDVGVSGVTYAIQDRSTGSWWTGSAWGAETWHAAALASPGATSTTWSATWSPPAGGTFLLAAAATDAAGNRSETWREFQVATAPPDTVPPDTAVTSPTDLEVIPPGDVTLTGTATDDVGVAGVEIAIKHRVTNQWLRLDGTWGGLQWHQATLASPGATSTGWSFTWANAPEGEYGFSAKAVDGAGNVDASRPWTRFDVAPPPAETVPPDATVTSPTDGASLELGPITLSGTATDNAAVAMVQVAIKDRTSGLWWHADGTWGGFEWQTATLASPGATSTTWSYGWTPPATGAYAFSVRTVDASGNDDPVRPWTRFDVVEPGGDTVPPDGQITSPTPNATLPAGPVTLTGTATDDVAIASVDVAVKNATTGQWLQANGTWGAGFAWLAATVDTVGATSTGWSYTWTPPAAGPYGTTVRAVDTSGNVDGVRPWVRFSVS